MLDAASFRLKQDAPDAASDRAEGMADQPNPAKESAMAKTSVPRSPRSTKDSASLIPKPPKGLSLADIVAVTHTIGNHVTKVGGPELAQLIDATRHLHDPDDSSDFIDPISIAIELGGVADVLIELMEDDRPSALGYLSDQLRRLSNRVAAISPRSVNQQPDWYKVEVKR